MSLDKIRASLDVAVSRKQLKMQLLLASGLNYTSPKSPRLRRDDCVILSRRWIRITNSSETLSDLRLIHRHFWSSGNRGRFRQRFVIAAFFETYEGAAVQYDYSPPVCAEKNNLIANREKVFVIKEGMLELEPTFLTSTPVLEASACGKMEISIGNFKFCLDLYLKFFCSKLTMLSHVWILTSKIKLVHHRYFYCLTMRAIVANDAHCNAFWIKQ